MTGTVKHNNLPQRHYSEAYQLIAPLLEEAGVTINGPRAWDIQIHNPKMLGRVLSDGGLGLGEAYVDGDWDATSLDGFFDHILGARLEFKIKSIPLAWHGFKARLFNRQKQKRAWQVGLQHYDLDNDFFEAMLDSKMTYTCAYWGNGATTLEEAQSAKLDMICQKLALRPGMRLLDIGCGWGSLMAYAAEHYGVECVGVTVSREQAKWGEQRYAHLPVEFKLQDYRSLNQRFDRIASIGMFEHVGHKNHREYMQVVHRCLNDSGLFMLHTIGKNQRKSTTDRWIDQYIFPNGELPSMGQIGDAIDDLFVLEDVHNFGADYDLTLMAWFEHFNAAWPHFKERLGERFYRTWKYYLMCCAGAFRSRSTQLWQCVLSKNGMRKGYQRQIYTSQKVLLA